MSGELRQLQCNHIRSDDSGFTLIELVIIIVVLGILGGVVIPKYQDMRWDAMESAMRGALGGMREAISIYQSAQAIEVGMATYPPVDSMNTVGAVLVQSIPPNPYQDEDMAPDSVVVGATFGQVTAGRGGWVYNPNTGEIWANTSTTIGGGGGCGGGGGTPLNENTW